MVLSPDADRVVPGPGPSEEGGEGAGFSFTSLQMIDVELDGLGRISDQDEYPWRVAFNFAYPDRKVLIYVDGLSERIHGNEDQRRRDRRVRVKAELAGWRVCTISAEGLSDPVMVDEFLERLALLIGILG